ncbi:MAG: BrnT family toxin [Candidatus Binatia bacterium]
MALRFEWDATKEADNVRKHGVDFRMAGAAFDDPRLVLAEDAGHSGLEQRYFAFGLVGAAILTVRFTIRGDVIRIIGAGFWRRGREYYEEANRLFE